MDIHKNEKDELRLWAKDDIVPSDLQGLCKQAATSIAKLQERIKELEAVIQAALRISDLWTLKEVETMFEDEAKALEIMKTGFEQALKEQP